MPMRPYPPLLLIPLVVMIMLVISPLLFTRAIAEEVTGEAPQEGEAAEAAPHSVVNIEQQVVAALRAQLGDGEAITLQVEGDEVLALFRQQTRGQALGGVLLLHDLSGHPDWPAVIRPLRRQLPAAGWHTLALQLPHAASAQYTTARLDAMRPRIAAALAELERRGILNLVLVGYGEGALAAIDYLSANLVPAVQGVVVISLNGSQNAEPRLDGASALAQLTLPILDIYGEHDTRAVVESAKRRYDLARRKMANDGRQPPAYADIASRYTPKLGRALNYRQLVIAGANRHFIAQDDLLVKRLRGWLAQHAAGNELKTTN